MLRSPVRAFVTWKPLRCIAKTSSLSFGFFLIMLTIRLAAASRDACDTPPNSTKVCAAIRRKGSLNVLYPFCATASVWRATPPASPLDTFSKWPVLVMVSSNSIAPRPCLSKPKPNCWAKSCKPSSNKPSLVSIISSCLPTSFASFASCFAVRFVIALSSSI